jgi:cell division protein FtsQ
MKNSQITTSIKRLLSAGLVFGMAMVVLSVISRKSDGGISRVVVTVEPLPGGYRLLEAEDVLANLEERFAYPLESRTLAQLDIERVERVLEEDPFVKDAEAFVDANNQVNIEIIQNLPVLRIKDNNELDYYLDENAQQMPPSKHYAARVLVATGNLPPHVPDFMERERSTLRHVFELTKLIMADEFLNALIEQIYVNNRGELILAPKIGKQTIMFGRYMESNAADRLKRLKIFYSEGLPYEGWRKYRSFDLRYDDQVVGIKR